MCECVARLIDLEAAAVQKSSTCAKLWSWSRLHQALVEQVAQAQSLVQQVAQAQAGYTSTRTCEAGCIKLGTKL